MRSRLFRKILALARKEARIELRSRAALGAQFMFALVTLAVISLAVGDSALTPKLAAGLFWVTLFFGALTGVAHSFVKEEDARTAATLRALADADTVFWGKFLFNLLLALSQGALVTPLFFALTGTAPQSAGVFALALLCGVVGLAGATTIVSAIVSQAATRGALFTALAVPTILPLLLLLVDVTAGAFSGASLAESLGGALGLIAYCGLMLTVSTLLFEYVWRS